TSTRAAASARPAARAWAGCGACSIPRPKADRKSAGSICSGRSPPISQGTHPTDDLPMADFMNNLDLVNGLAERSKGFVWRLKDESNNATNFRHFDDPSMAGNL